MKDNEKKEKKLKIKKDSDKSRPFFSDSKAQKEKKKK